MYSTHVDNYTTSKALCGNSVFPSHSLAKLAQPTRPKQDVAHRESTSACGLVCSSGGG